MVGYLMILTEKIKGLNNSLSGPRLEATSLIYDLVPATLSL
jgi:hypothetical protein